MLAATMTCALCEPIGAQQIANTGRGYYLGQPAGSMTSLGPSNDDELRACPSCGDLFHYTSEQAQTGSGNNDDDVITRLPAEVTATLNAVRTNSLPLPELAARIAALPRGVGRTHGPSIIEDVTRRALVPHYLDLLERGSDGWIAELVRSVADYDPALVKRELADRPDVPVLAPLRAHVRVAGCSICRGVTYYPPLPPPAALRAMKIRADNDLFDCPECDSLFKTEGGKGVARVHDWLRTAVRECVRRTGTVSSESFEAIFRCGRDWQALLDSYAEKYDGELAEQLRRFRANRK
jgi:uncharacterized C2H2 Zn-finger protein